jgi:DNA-binding NarL/FixJ family response regulator
MAPLRVLVADDHPFFRNGLKTLLESAPDTEFVGEAEWGNLLETKTPKAERENQAPDLEIGRFGLWRFTNRPYRVRGKPWR